MGRPSEVLIMSATAVQMTVEACLLMEYEETPMGKRVAHPAISNARLRRLHGHDGSSTGILPFLNPIAVVTRILNVPLLAPSDCTRLELCDFGGLCGSIVLCSIQLGILLKQRGVAVP